MTNHEDVSFWRRNQLGAPIAGVVLVLIALMGISVSQAGESDAAEELSEQDDRDSSGWGGVGHRGRRGHSWFRGRGHDPERAKDHMHFAAGWMLHRLDVGAEVKAQIQARLDTAFDDLSPLVVAHRENRSEWLEAVLRDEVDRASLEDQRQEAIVAATQASEIVVTALADVAEMLSPEQRSALLNRIREHHSH